ncbi:methyltransferase domain-containing protein [Phenylobacterium sp.]|jgi:ubiquinone/menaquinone biosynthesis C-methylase UbiE|uniref:methyltransferase domain-containing protein n=1 Tax=Phenylobacterium sp. TaxID=1871053 RepID=UPI002ED959F3
MSRPTHSSRRPGWHWSEYWQSGRTEIMTVDTAQGPVTFDPGKAWTSFFTTFQDGARLIDLATGGGQVARLGHAAAVAAGKSLDIVGVDYADLGPNAGDLAPGLRLMGGVPLERLPFPDRSFDGASSQFGIEYADVRLAIGEVARVLKPDARARFLIHHTESAVSRAAVAQTTAHDRVLPDDAAIQKARRAFGAHLKRLPPAGVRAAEDAFREAVRRAAARLEPSDAFQPARYHVDYLADLAGGLARYEPKSALARLDVFEAGVAAWRQRHRNQIKVALDRGGLDAFLQRSAGKGLETVDAAAEHDERGALIAWRVDLRRN